jgi:hypothetical protein
VGHWFQKYNHRTECGVLMKFVFPESEIWNCYMRCTVALSGDRWAVAEIRNVPKFHTEWDFSWQRWLQVLYLSLKPFDNPVFQQIVFLFYIRYIFLLGPLCVSTQTTVKCDYPEEESTTLCLIIIAVCYWFFSSVKFRFKMSRKQSASKELNFLEVYISRSVIKSTRRC